MMQAGNISCTRQRFALTKCSCSQEKKSRKRKSKEERRAMVESFISKYRNSNNGNFPSVNLTQKEVGGSFYTVREIVRDVIQENRVLGPGSLNLKSLSFEDCPDELNSLPSLSVDESQAEEIEHSQNGNLKGDLRDFSVSPDVYTEDHNGMEILLTDEEKKGDENHVLVNENEHLGTNFSKNGNLDVILTDNELIVDEPSDLLETEFSQNENKGELNSTLVDQNGYTLVETIDGSLDILEMDISKNGNQNKDLSVTDPIIETNIGMDNIENSKFEINEVSDSPEIKEEAIEKFPVNGKLPGSSTETDNSLNGNNETKGLSSSSELFEIPKSADEFDRFDHMFDFDKSSVERIDKNPADIGKKESVFVSELKSVAPKNEELLEVKPKNVGNIKIEEVKFDRIKSISTTPKEELGSVLKSKHEAILTNTTRNRRVSTKKERERAASNPILNTLRAFITAVIRFWTE